MGQNDGGETAWSYGKRSDVYYQSVPAGIENVFIAMFYKGYFNGDFFDTIMDTIKR